ncbi:hypothetical protein [Magnetococcus sp. PR-3]|uniref:hypothetical protein n=1 Tax=Magnetococcus sp. PR-3 TaxID=3120355 RepID=UPI002FCE0871
MLSKILIILLVIGGVYGTGRLHARKQEVENRPPSPRRIAAAKEAEQDNRNARRLGLGVLAAILVMGGFMGYNRWAEGQEIQLIRVINSQSGEVSTYRAKSKDIHHRDFLTTDGRQIRLADLERMEVEATGEGP